ncbi:MAG: PocR ligand-binding domain-containing protein [Lachnospiraceae bacterium]|nr:PocR ligand-binding domain-containing protein [Lachnospiraceae bacterium]
MVSIKDGVIQLEYLEMEDVIDINTLQKFLDNFAIGMNCAAVSVNRKGEEVTRPSHYRDFCSNYIHSNSLGDSRCATCHNQMGEMAVRSGRPHIGECHAGLIDFAAPIIIKGEHIGTVLGGQILDRKPNEVTIKRVAGELRIQEDSLWEAAQKIDIVDKRNINAAAEVLNVVVNTLAQDGYKRLETETLSGNLATNFIQISATVDLLAQSAQQIAASQQILSNEIDEINVVTKQIEQVLKDITRVANTTKLIGFNAAIEAARLGNDGKGFAVVANEIQLLSDSSKETASHITELNKQINAKINTTVANADKTVEITEEQSASMEELAATIQNSVELAAKLKDLFNIK